MPTYASWKEAVVDLRIRAEPVTEGQLRLAAHTGLQLPRELPKLVAAVRLMNGLSPQLCKQDSGPPTDGQIEYLSSLNEQRARDPNVLSSREEAQAWIEFYLIERRLQSLEGLKLEAGDVIAIKDKGERLAQVNSIGSDGRVYFRGGGNASDWPDKIKVMCRRADNSESAIAMRKNAANQAASRSKSNNWSSAKERQLKEFKVDSALTPEDVEGLSQTIDAAADESAIQKFLEERPQVLASLLGGNSRFSIPRPRLGAEYVPDFFLADVDSLGIRWVFVELETPASSITLKSENSLEKRARKGVSQVQEWRHWITNNLDLARRSRRDQGLGFVDISDRSEGLVLVGRRDRLNQDPQLARRDLRDNSHIRVHTYDWLIERLSGVLNYNGPPGANPNVIQPLRESEESWI